MRQVVEGFNLQLWQVVMHVAGSGCSGAERLSRLPSWPEQQQAGAVWGRVMPGTNG